MRTSQLFEQHLTIRRCWAIILIILFMFPSGFCVLTPDFGKTLSTKQSQEPYEEIPPYTPSSFPSGSLPTSGSWSQEFFENVSLPENVSLEDVDWLSLLTYEGIADLEKVLFTVSPANPPRYWRVTTYDNYTGRIGDSAGKWTQTNQTTTPLDLLPSPNPLNYTITMNIDYDAIFTRYLPVLWPQPLILDGSLEVGVEPLSYEFLLDSYQDVIFNATFKDSGSTTLKYMVSYVFVNLTQIRLKALPQNYTPQEIKNIYGNSSVPPLSQYVYDFASQFEGKGENTFETALIVLRYFQVNFDYDYDMWFGTSNSSGPSQDQDWVEWFLQRRKGISIHFATAYIITLRILGISARLVFGFLPGEESRGSRIVKNKHLHFWAEVWIPIKTDSGVDGVWVAFDPSPPGYLEALNTERDQFVINPRYTLTITSSHENVTRRGVPVNLTATLLSDGEPLPNETITFTDIYDSLTLNGATSITNESGVATLTFYFTDDSLIGLHVIVANWKLLNNQTTIILAGNTTITVTVTPDEVARTEVARISGVLSDAKNGRGFPNQEITIIWEGKNFSAVFHTTTKSDGGFSFSYTVPLSHPLGNATVYAIYDGNFTSLISSSSNTTNVTVVAKVKFTVSVTPNEVRRNETIVVEGFLLLDNDTPLSYENVTVYWENSTVGGRINILEIVKTDENGYYNFTATIPANHSLGFSYIFFGYNSTIRYIRSGNSTKSQILIYERVFVYVNVSLTRVGRSNSLTIFGNITGEDYNEPIEGATIRILFNNTGIGVTNVTNMQGQFTATFNVPPDLEVGVYVVRVTVSSPSWFKGSGEYACIIIYGFSSISVEGSPLYVLPGEQLNVTGIIIDERGDPIQNAEIQVIFNKTLLATLTSNEQGSFEGNVTIPDVPAPNLTITFLYEETDFYNASTTSINVFVFKNAVITVVVNNTDYLEAYPGEGLIITGNVVDERGRYIIDREVKLYVNETPYLIYLDEEGNFTVFYTLPEDVNPGNITIYATLKAKTRFKSNEVIVLVKVRQKMWKINVPVQLLYIIVVVAFALSSTFLFFKKFWKGFRRQKKPEIDISSPIMTINDYVRQAKFKEAIIEAYNLFEKILRAYFNVERPGSLTPREFAINAVKEYRLNPDATYLLIKMYEKARFSHHEVGLEDYNSFVKAFSTIYRQVTGRALELAQK